ncbi:hypothetical protein ACS0TY_000307 [Phlomoides rotata]
MYVCYNDDLLIEILLWLPAKSLIRFKYVCKHWLSLISTDQFCHLHTLRHPKPQPSLILHAQTSHFFYFHPILNAHKLVPYSFTIPNPKILSSSNGLLLLQSDLPEKSYYVYNPTTKQSRKIALTSCDKYTKVLGLNLAFDPSVSSYYKIVCVRAVAKPPAGAGGRCCQIEVYDSKSYMWKLCLEPFTATINTNFSSGVHWNNAIHWENFPRTHLYFDTNKNGIGNLPHSVIPWRGDGAGGAASCCQLQESNGRLYHFIIVSHLGDKSIAVYELQDDYSEWLLKYHDGFDRLPGRFRILSFIQGETCTLLTHVPGKIMAYRFLDKSSEELIDLTDEPFYREDSVQFDSRNVHQFGESMAPQILQKNPISLNESNDDQEVELPNVGASKVPRKRVESHTTNKLACSSKVVRMKSLFPQKNALPPKPNSDKKVLLVPKKETSSSASCSPFKVPKNGGGDV